METGSKSPVVTQPNGNTTTSTPGNGRPTGTPRLLVKDARIPSVMINISVIP